MSQTPVPTQQGGAVAVPQEWGSTGLEDFSVTDAVLPRLKIMQKEGRWLDGNSGLSMETLRFIPLGLVKQRVLFHHNVEDNDVPMCKSSDFETGYPNPDAPKNKSFPWELSGFDYNDFAPDANGDRKLPCSGCALKDWGSSPTGDTPYCSEQWTLPIYYDASSDFSGDWTPAILTLQKSNIKPIRTYLTSFAQSNKPSFLAVARGTLKVLTRGQVEYSIATFIKEGESPRERWQEFSEQYQEMRTFLTRPPVREIDEEGQSSDNTNTAPQQQAPAQPDPWTQPQQQSQANDPWATPQQPPAQQAPVQPQQQAPAPVQQQAPPPPAQPQQQTPPPAGQDLPF